jgi:phosphohistidine swiveling domain-containing protein
MSTPWIDAGSGVPTGFASPAEGRLCEITGPADAVALLAEMDDGPTTGVIVLVHEAGGTTVGPLLGGVAGIVSTTGTLGAHIALLAKEYDCPCIVGAILELPDDEIVEARLETDGTIRIRVGSGA